MSSVPAAFAAMAKMPNGVSRTMNRAAGDRADGRAQHVEQRLLLVHTNEGEPGHNREQHHRGHDVVGQRVERIRRDVEVQEVEGLATGRRRTVERARCGCPAGPPGRGTRKPAQSPRCRQHRPSAEREVARPAIGQRAEVDDDRERHVRQHGHLQHPDELLASGPSGATASPKKSPTRMPSPSPASTWCENRMRVGPKCTARRGGAVFRAWSRRRSASRRSGEGRCP